LLKQFMLERNPQAQSKAPQVMDALSAGLACALGKEATPFLKP
jgi:hypothetical protein